MLHKLRNIFSKDPEYVDEYGNYLSQVDTKRVKFFEFRKAFLDLNKALQDTIAEADELENELQEQISNTEDKINKGNDSLLSVYQHLLDRFQRAETSNLIEINKQNKQLDVLSRKFLKSFDDLKKSLSKYGDYMYKQFMLYNKGIERAKMPQIDDNDKLKKELKLTKRKVKLQEIKPLQKEIDEDKVQSFLANGYKIPKEWIVSNDNYAMDGHHRWAATLEIYDPEDEVDVYSSDKNAEEFLEELTKGTAQEKVAKVMSEFKDGTLHIGRSDKIVTDRKQAIAIALHEAGLSKASIDELIENDIINIIKGGKKKYVAGIWNDYGGRILFLKRHHEDDFHPNEWCLPGGGIDAGETPEEAMKREWKEETNLELNGLFEAKIVDVGDAIIHYYFVSPAEEDDPIALLDSESNQYAFYAEEEWKSMDLLLDLKEHLKDILQEPVEKGIYVNNLENRKLGRVGQKYGGGDITSIEDAEKVVRAIEAGKDKGHMHAKMNYSGIPDSSSGYSEKTEAEALYILRGNPFLEHSFEQVRDVKYPSLTKDIYNQKREEAKEKYGHLKHLREKYKPSLKKSNEQKITLVHNKEKAPYMGSRFGQDVEPTGYYATERESHHTDNLPNYETNEFTLKKPLTINVTDDTLVEWKRDLAKKYKAKGKQLSAKLMEEGYDSIITVREDGTKGEIIILKAETNSDDLFIEEIQDIKKAAAIKGKVSLNKKKANKQKKINFNKPAPKGQGSIKGKPGYVEKKVLVHQKGKKPFWQTKWVKEMEEINTPSFKVYSIDAVAKSLGTKTDILKELTSEIDQLIINGHYYDVEDSLEDMWKLKLVGVVKGKKPKNIEVILKDTTKLTSKEEVKKEEKEEAKKGLTIKNAINIVNSALDKKVPILFENEESGQVSGTEKYTYASVYAFDEEKKELEVAFFNTPSLIDKPPYMLDDEGNPLESHKITDEASVDNFLQAVLNQLQANKEKMEKQKNWNKPDPKIEDKDFKEIKHLGGSTGAVLVEDKNGVKYVRKGGKNKSHRENELLTIQLYKAFGVNAPTGTLVTKNYIYNKYVEGESLGSWLKGKSDEEKQAMYDKIGQGFMVDALLGNWDVIGLDYDNILVDKADVPVRIDVGGAMAYRAQGTPKKKEEWEDSKGVDEIVNMLDAQLSPQAADIFGKADMDLFRQADNLPNTLPAWIPAKDKKILKARLDWLKDNYEGLPTNLDDLGDMYEVPAGANEGVKTFYKKLNEVMKFTPKDQKILVDLAESGSHTAKEYSSEEYAKSNMHLSEEKEKGYVGDIGLNYRELRAIVHHTGSGSSGFNSALRQLAGGMYNIVEEGKVVKYKEEFADVAKDAFNINNVIYDKLADLRKVVNFSKKGGSKFVEGAYGVSNVQQLKELNEMLGNTVKNPESDIHGDIAKFYKKHAEGILKAFNEKKEYKEDIGIYMPSDELKEKYAEIVDLSLITNPVNWDTPEFSKVMKAIKSKGNTMSSWGHKNGLINLMGAKLVARGLIKAERSGGKSKYVKQKSTPLSRKLHVHDVNDFVDQHSEGNTVYWSNISSTSTSFSVWSGNVKCRITPIGGLHTAPISAVGGGEQEVTLKPFPRMKVTNVKKEGGVVYIDLVQMG